MHARRADPHAAFADQAPLGDPLIAGTAAPRLVHGDVSLELSPDGALGFDPAPGALPPGAKIFLTHLAGHPESTQIQAARRMIGLGFTPVPHFAARNYGEDDDFRRHLEAHLAAGVRHGLFLGGNPLRHDGPFHQALDLLAHPALSGAGMEQAFIGGYPEGHPEIDDATLTRVREDKIAAARDAGIDVALVSQFAFDGPMIGDWAQRMQAAHPGLPVRLGVAGVTSVPKLIKFAAMCGVGPSLAALKRGAGGLMNVLSERDPSSLIAGIEQACPAPAAPLDLHLFPFGGWRKTLDWLARAQSA